MADPTFRVFEGSAGSAWVSVGRLSRVLISMALVGVGLALATLVGGCAVVPQNHRAHFAEPVMRDSDDALDDHRKRKLYTTREAAAGGDGKTAGGGCSCQ